MILIIPPPSLYAASATLALYLWNSQKKLITLHELVVLVYASCNLEPFNSSVYSTIVGRFYGL